jgi:hypothetical protein
MSIYTDNGFKNRRDYLASLAQDFGIELETVLMAASLLGPDEDFDGLVCALEDESERRDREVIYS